MKRCLLIEKALPSGPTKAARKLEQAECGHHGTCRQHLDLEVAAGHVVDFLGVIDRELVKDVLRSGN
jgi:hypothetical protein